MAIASGVENYFDVEFEPREPWPRPNFTLLVEELEDRLALHLDLNHLPDGDELTPRVQTNVSMLETIYPRILRILGMPIELNAYEIGLDGEAGAGVVGRYLHEADALFSIILQGYGGERAGVILPSLKREQVAPFVYATDGLPNVDNLDEISLANVLIEAWTRYLRQKQGTPVGTIPFFAGAGFTNPAALEAALESEQLLELGDSLARAWARAVRGDDLEAWEFTSGVRTYREQRVIVNLSCGIQIAAHLDGVSFWVDRQMNLWLQSLDLKTSLWTPTANLQAEIQFRQAQLLQLVVEIVAAGHYQNTAQFARTLQENLYTVDHRTIYLAAVASSGFKVFDKASGQLRVIPFENREGEREEFDRWLQWYGMAVYLLRRELKYYD